MKIETLKDFLMWTQKFHQNLAVCMKDCADKNEDEPAKMMLKYLSRNENKLATIIGRFTLISDEKALNTWTYEFFDKSTIIQHDVDCIEPFKEIKPKQIVDKVIIQHNEIITLYRDLYSIAVVASTKELLEELISLEENHIKQMAQSANRMNDL
ncbi:MAG: ATPase [Leucothrix sp.]